MNYYLLDDFLRRNLDDPAFLFYVTWYYFLVIILEASFLTLAGYKNFGWSVLYSFISNTVSFGISIWYVFLSIYKPFSLESAFTYWITGSILIEFLVCLLFIWKSRFINLVTGILMANLISATISVIGLIIRLFYL